MAKFNFDTADISRAQHALETVYEGLYERLRKLRDDFERSPWRDNIYEATKKDLNEHICQMNKVFASLEIVKNTLEELSEEAKEYLALGR